MIMMISAPKDLAAAEIASQDSNAATHTYLACEANSATCQRVKESTVETLATATAQGNMHGRNGVIIAASKAAKDCLFADYYHEYHAIPAATKVRKVVYDLSKLDASSTEAAAASAYRPRRRCWLVTSSDINAAYQEASSCEGSLRRCRCAN